MNSERQIILAGLKTHLGVKTRKEFDFQLQLANREQDFDWSRIDRIAVRNGIVSILFSVFGKSNIDGRLQDRWMRYAVQTGYNNSRGERATAILFQAFENEDIPAVVMRGMALNQWIYCGRELRPMCDVDVLVPACARETLVDKLARHALRCERRLRSQFIYQIDQTKFEIHWSIMTPRRYRDVVKIDNWQDCRRRFSISDGYFYGFSPEHEMIGLVCHSYIHHEHDNLLKLVDIALVANTKGFDWGYLREWVSAASLTRMFFLTFALIDYLFRLNLVARFFDQARDFQPGLQILEAHASRYFEKDDLSAVMTRKRALMYVAEGFDRKLRQAIRFLSKDQISEFIRAYQRA